MVPCARGLVLVLFSMLLVIVEPLPIADNAVFLKQRSTASAEKPHAATRMEKNVIEEPLGVHRAYSAWKVIASGAVVGSVFGLMGSGASMLMKPLLYYGFDQYPFKLTIFEMYAILVPLAFFGATRGYMKGRVAWHHVGILAFFTSGIGTSLGSLMARWTTSHAQLLLFAGLVLLVAMHMGFPAQVPQKTSKDKVSQNGEAPHLASFDLYSALVAIIVGILSGFVGVGGGFMLTPLLCHFGHSMDTAVPTALAVICLSACSGIFWYVNIGNISIKSLDGTLIASLALAGCLGLLASDYMSGLVDKTAKQKIFSVLLVVIGTSVIISEALAPIH